MDVFRQKYEEIKSEIPGDMIAQVLSKIKDGLRDRPLVLYGAGRMVGVFLDYCRECGLTVSCVCDSFKSGTYNWRGENLRILGLDTIKKDYHDATIIICSYTYNNEIYENLIQNEFIKDRIIQYPALSPYVETARTFEHHVNGYEWAYNFFDDERSRQLVLDRIRLYLLDQPMCPNTSCTYYYEDGLISLSNNEIYIDAGTYDGNTVEMFIEKMREVEKNYSRIYAFEPSISNYEKAVKRLSGYLNVEMVQKGLWSTETKLSFFENSMNQGGSSFTLGSGDGLCVPVTSLDAFFKNSSDNELPTFIKMDIEGAEKEALLGATSIIRRLKPKLVVCAYHKPEDIYELPKTILNIRDDYRFALRQHFAGCYDTVLYAV